MVAGIRFSKAASATKFPTVRHPLRIEREDHACRNDWVFLSITLPLERVVFLSEDAPHADANAYAYA